MLAYIASGYVVASIVLYLCPRILHKPKLIPFPTRFVAHRGGGGEKTENTLSAFREAKKLNADLFELDVQLTKDGEVVVCHDNNLSRVCGVNGNISDYNLCDLPLCLREMEVACEPNDFLYVEKPEPILRLEDLYREFPKVPIQIDVKPGGLELITKVSDLTKKYDREECTVWGAFSHKTTNICRALNPKMLTFCSMLECSIYPLLLLIGLLPWIPIKAEFYQVPIPNISNKSGFLSTFNKQFCELITPIMCNRFLLWHFHQRGIRTGAWVLNHPHEFAIADNYGFGGIMTDYPTRFVQYEKERRQKSE